MSGKKLYIIGIKDLTVMRDVLLTLKPLPFSKGSVLSWEGDSPPVFPLQWSLTAGFDHPAVRDRLALMAQIKLAHAMAASAGAAANGALKGPPKVRLCVPGHINCVGVMKRVQTSENGPWQFAGANLPTTCSFSVEFWPVDAYDPSLITVDNTETWLSPQVLGKFYQR